jgi:hypothetical protein
MCLRSGQEKLVEIHICLGLVKVTEGGRISRVCVCVCVYKCDDALGRSNMD